MLRLTLIPVLLMVAGLPACGKDDPGAAAERRFEMASKADSKPDKCDAAKDAAKAYLDAGDQEKYEFWKLLRVTYCGS